MTAGRMPVLFVGHGSPMNAVEDNAWSRGFRKLGALVPRPRAILCISAHWYTSGTFVTGQDAPRTIHDFGGFPPALYAIQYPAAGDPALARQVVALLGDERASASSEWGLDHGAWSVLRHMFPEADCPVVQLSVDRHRPPPEHIAIARKLGPLRDEGVLVMGSGNAVHNLHDAFTRLAAADTETPGWATRFDDGVARALEGHDEAWLAEAPSTADGRIAHPTVDHYLPLLYAAGASNPSDAVSFPVTGFDLGSISMRAVWFGPRQP